MSNKDIILVIHGTFNRPDLKKKPEWFEPDPADKDNFCTMLNAALKGTNLEDAVWRDIDRTEIFSWTGDNNHYDRCCAAEDLRDYMLAMLEKDPELRIHIVAHSHGGNVALKAIELYYDYLIENVPSVATDEVEKRSGFIFDGDHRRARMAAKLAEERLRCIMSSESNRLGKVVFLGTPFYRKHWIGPQKAGGRVTKYAVKNLPAAVGLLAVFWLVVPLFSMLLYSLPIAVSNLYSNPGSDDFWVVGVGWDITEWPIVVTAGWLFFCTLAFLIGYLERKRFNTDIYFSADSSLHQLLRNGDELVNHRPRCLVVSHFVDEAYLGISSADFVYSLLKPTIADVIEPSGPSFFTTIPNSTDEDLDRGFKGFVRSVSLGLLALWRDWIKISMSSRQPLAIGESRTMGMGYIEAYAMLFLVPFRFVMGVLYIFTVYWWWRPLVHFVIVPRATQITSNVFSSIAFGIPVSELGASRIEITDKLDMPEVFAVKEYELVVDESMKSLQRSNPKERYIYVGDDKALKGKIDESREKKNLLSWTKVEPYLKQMYQRYLNSFSLNPSGEPVERDKFDRKLERLWLKLQDRAEEVADTVRLVHSRYYIETRCIEEIAKFLTKPGLRN